MTSLTDDKVAVLGAAGAIGSNITQFLLCSQTASWVMMHDPYDPGLQGAWQEMLHSSFPGAKVERTTELKEALEGARFVITSGGAARTADMTREDLLVGNGEIARELGESIKANCPDASFVIVIFNPADITGLTTAVHSGLPPERVVTLAALDSGRLQAHLAVHLGVPQDSVQGCRVFGGHGESMAIFKSGITVQGRPIADLEADGTLTAEGWDEVQKTVKTSGKRIIQLRGRSSFQSPAHHAVKTLRAHLSPEEPYPWPSGVYVSTEEFPQIVMAMDSRIDAEGVHWEMPHGDDADMAALKASYEHLTKLRDESVGLGFLPPLEDWGKVNPNLA